MNSRQQGISLIELLIGMAVGLIILAGISTLIVNNLAANRTAINSARLNQQLRSAMDLIVREVRRANYDPSIMSQIGVNTGISIANNVSLDQCSESSCKQLNYAYRVQTGALVPKIITLSDGVISLEAGGDSPQPLTDPKTVAVDALEFCYVNAVTGECSASLPNSNILPPPAGGSSHTEILLIKISIAGHLQSDLTVTSNFVQTVRVRNDSFNQS